MKKITQIRGCNYIVASLRRKPLFVKKYFLALLLSFSGLASVFAQGSGTVISGSGTSNSTTIGASPVAIDATLTIAGSSNITDASVRVSSGFQSGDQLTYGSLPSGVTASYNSSTGVLTFSGTATAAAYQTLLRTVSFSSTSTSTTSRTFRFILGPNIPDYNGHFYSFVNTSTTWSSALTAAASTTKSGLTGYLAQIGSIGENNYITSIISTASWLGGSDDYSRINSATGTSYANQAASEGNWYWVTPNLSAERIQFSSGSTSVGSQYVNWGSSQPDNFNSTEHYLEILTNGTWNDLSATDNKTYVIEYGDNSTTLEFSRNMTIGTTITGSAYNLFYQMNTTAIVVDSNVSVYSASSINGATVTISEGAQSNDVLSYGTLPSGVTTTGYNATTGVVTFTGSASAADWTTFLRTVKYSNTNVNQRGKRVVTFSMGNSVSFSNGHFYQYVSTTTTWASAKTAAEGMTYLGLQGYLATITSSTENSFIKDKLAADAWIGGSDDYLYINAATGTTTYANQSASESHWYWVTGPEKGTNYSNNNNSPITVSGQYANWSGGEPNNVGASGEHYAEIYSSGSTGSWNDLPASYTLPYVVEYGGTPTDPAVKISQNRTIMTPIILNTTGNWGTASNWNLSLVPSSTDNVYIAAPGTVNGSYTINDLTINSGQTLTIPAGQTLTVTGTLNNLGTITGAGTLILNGTVVQTLNGTVTPANLNINNAAGVTATSNVTVSGNLTTTAGTLNMGTNTLSIGGNVVRNGTTQTGDIDASAGTVVFNGTTNQTLPNLAFKSNAFKNLTLNNTGSSPNNLITPSSALTVNGVMTFTAGNLNIAGNNFTFGTAATTAGTPSSSSMIIASGGGNVIKMVNSTGGFTFPIGDNSGMVEYSPVGFNLSSASISAGAYVTANVVNARHPNMPPLVSTYIDRYWNIASSGLTSIVSTITYNYVDADIHGTESTLHAGIYRSGSWNPGDPVIAASNTLIFSSTSSLTGALSAGPLVALNFGEVLTPSASCVNGSPVIKWVSSSENNTSSYQLLQLTETGKWEVLQNINAYKGNTNKYSITLQSNNNHFGIRVLDNSGKAIAFFPVNSNCQTLLNSGILTVYPNPVSSLLTLDIAVNKIQEVSLFNVQGQLCNAAVTAQGQKTSMNLSALSAGVYYLYLKADDQVFTHKIIKH